MLSQKLPGIMELRGQVSIIILLVTLIFARIVYVLSLVGRRSTKPPVKGTLSTLLVLGSGGHTAEMLKLVSALDPARYRPRHYIAAATDTMSLQRAKTAEELQSTKAATPPAPAPPPPPPSAHYSQIYRSREVGQSYVTSVFTTLLATAHAFWIVFRIQPDVILCNGPGTCLPICLAGFCLRVSGLKSVSLVYVESAARVQKLSLTGLILFRLRITDRMFVQWPELQNKYRGTQYVGRLM